LTLAAAPNQGSFGAPLAVSATPLLEVRDLCKSFEGGGVIFSRTRKAVVDKVSFTLARGQSAALVGASGSGKSTIARMILRLIEPDSGQLLLDGKDVLATERGGASQGYRRRVQMVFQDPFASLNPIHDVLTHLALPLLIQRKSSKAELRARAIAVLETVGLSPAAEMLSRHPHQLSGGQRQRVAIARALAAEPELLVADEPTSMLDVSLRVGVLLLLQRMQRERGLAILLITHDLSSARFLAERILVLHQGRLVEQGDAERLIANPLHAYTQALLNALPDPSRNHQ
jgi:peptide/nickel transport system ATP-binding protein